MKERHLSLEQKQHNFGLTACVENSYAGSSQYLLMDTGLETNRTSEASAKEAEQKAEEYNKEKDIKEKWKKFLENKYEEKKPEKPLADALEKLNVTPEEYKKHHEYYKKFGSLYETKLSAEKIQELTEAWQTFFDKSDDSKNEYYHKKNFINSLITRGLSPRDFSKHYNWAAYFKTPAPESIIAILVKKLFTTVLASYHAPEQKEEKPEKPTAHPQTAERAKLLTELMWQTANELRESQGKPVESDERQAQKQMIDLNIAPDIAGTVRQEDVVAHNASLEEPDRKKAAQELLGEMSSDQEEALIKAHNVGSGEEGKSGKEASVYDYTQNQLRRKVEALRFGITGEELEKLSVEERKKLEEEHSGELFTREERRKLLEKGLAGNGVSGEDNTSNPGEEGISPGAAPHPGRDETQPSDQSSEQEGPRDPADNELNVLEELNNQGKSRQRPSPGPGGIRGDVDAFEAYYGRQPESFDDLVKEIVANEPNNEWKYGENGLFPLFETVYEKDASGNVVIENGKPKAEKRWRQIGRGKNAEYREEDRIRVNPGNFHRWVMDKIAFLNDQSPVEQINFMNDVALKRARGGAINLSQILGTRHVYLKTEIWNEETKEYEDYILEDLYHQLVKDIVPYTKERNAEMEYGGVMPDAKAISSFMQKFHANPSDLTRYAFNSSYMRWGYYTPRHFESAIEKAKYSKQTLSKKQRDELDTQDGEIGAAKALAETVYRYISVFDGTDHSLVGALGSESPFFQKNELLAMRERLAVAAGQKPHEYISDADINKMFPDPSTVKKNDTENYLWVTDPEDQTKTYPVNKKAFVRFFNIFDVPQQDQRKEKFVRSMVSLAITHKHQLFNEDKGKENPITKERIYASEGNMTWYVKEKKGNNFVFRALDRDNPADKKLIDDGKKEGMSFWIVDETAKEIAENGAFFGVHWKGEAALNDPDGTGADWQARAFNAQAYRLKGPDRSRNNYSGNLRHIGQFKATIVDFMRGVQTLTPKKDKTGFKTPLDVVHEIVDTVEQARKLELQDNLSEDQKEKLKKLKAENLRDVTQQLIFKDQTQEKYFGDHWVRGHKVLEENLLNGKELDWKSFTEFDQLMGIYRIDMDKFGKAFEDFIKPWRYGISTWGQLDLSQEVDIPELDEDGKISGKIVTRKDQNGKDTKPILAQYLFGDEVLDHPRFWKKAEPFERGARLVEVADDTGKLTKVWKIPGLIDPAEFRTKDGKVQLYLNAAMISIGGQIVQHRKLFGKDKRYSDEFYESLFSSLESLPSGVWGDEIMSLQSVRLLRNAFTKHDIAWLRKISGTEEWKMAFLAIFKALGLGLWEGAMSQRKFVTNV